MTFNREKVARVAGEKAKSLDFLQDSSQFFAFPAQEQRASFRSRGHGSFENEGDRLVIVQAAVLTMFLNDGEIGVDHPDEETLEQFKHFCNQDKEKFLKQPPLGAKPEKKYSPTDKKVRFCPKHYFVKIAPETYEQWIAIEKRFEDVWSSMLNYVGTRVPPSASKSECVAGSPLTPTCLQFDDSAKKKTRRSGTDEEVEGDVDAQMRAAFADATSQSLTEGLKELQDCVRADSKVESTGLTGKEMIEVHANKEGKQWLYVEECEMLQSLNKCEEADEGVVRFFQDDMVPYGSLIHVAEIATGKDYIAKRGNHVWEVTSGGTSHPVFGTNLACPIGAPGQQRSSHASMGLRIFNKMGGHPVAPQEPPAVIHNLRKVYTTAKELVSMLLLQSLPLEVMRRFAGEWLDVVVAPYWGGLASALAAHPQQFEETKMMAEYIERCFEWLWLKAHGASVPGVLPSMTASVLQSKGLPRGVTVRVLCS